MIVQRIKNIFKKVGNLKVNVAFAAKFKILVNGEMVGEIKFINTENDKVLPSIDIYAWYNEKVLVQILVKVEDLQETDSGWSLSEIINLMVNFNKYLPINSGISTFIDLPKYIKDKKVVVNIQNNVFYCFLWSVIAALHPAKNHICETPSYPHFNSELKHDGIQFPITLEDIPKFEKMNELCISVYGIEDDKKYMRGEIAPLYLSNEKSRFPTIHLLMIENTNLYFNHFSENKLNDINSIYHLAWIKNLSRLVKS